MKFRNKAVIVIVFLKKTYTKMENTINGNLGIFIFSSVLKYCKRCTWILNQRYFVCFISVNFVNPIEFIIRNQIYFTNYISKLDSNIRILFISSIIHDSPTEY